MIITDDKVRRMILEKMYGGKEDSEKRIEEYEKRMEEKRKIEIEEHEREIEEKRKIEMEEKKKRRAKLKRKRLRKEGLEIQSIAEFEEDE